MIRYKQVLIIDDEMELLADEAIRSASVFGWLDVDFGFAQDTFRSVDKSLNLANLRNQNAIASAVKALRAPLLLIPASLHPIN